MKFNDNKIEEQTVENLAGGQAYAMTDELELVHLLLTSFVNDKFYEGKDRQIERIRRLVENVKDKKFVAQAAIFARNEFGMRSITHVLAAEMARVVKGEQWTKDAYAKIFRRPDDITETLAYFRKNLGKAIPNSLKKGIAIGLDKFDAYKLAKYRAEGHNLKMVDVFNLVHPKPSEKNKEAWEKLMKGELKNEKTWEAKISAAGKSEDKEKAKKDGWSDLIRRGELGYMALLRNLRNILEAGVDDEYMGMLISQLTNVHAIKKSLLFPFRFATAKKELGKVNGSSNILTAIDVAADISLGNVPNLPGKTLIALDVSGSMTGKPAEIGGLFAAALFKKNVTADLMTFDSNARYVNISRGDSVLTTAEKIPFTGGGTSFISIFQTANVAYDRIIILSDMQGWQESEWTGFGISKSAVKEAFKAYKVKTGSNPMLYSFDLNGYGTLQFPEDKVICIAGFSEKIFEVMKLAEEDQMALINKIKSIEI